MNDDHLRVLQCPRCKKRFPPQPAVENGEIVCQKGHTWTVENGIPALSYPPPSEEDAKWIMEYDEMAKTYDDAVKLYDDWLGIDMMKERSSLSSYIPIEGRCRILDVSVGTAANFEAILNSVPQEMDRLSLHGLDLSRGMLQVSAEKAQRLGFSLNLTYGSVFNLPFRKNSFEVVIHSGGLNTFSDIPRALEEIHRVLAPKGFAVVIDEGLSPQKRETEEGKAIIETNSLFAARPPIEHVPDRARDVEVTYVMNDTFYQIVFSK
ncbi:MAG: class I SAM-dependent methyltransferase [Candidatus Thorarchaeota archaeon]|nr:MAG: hypothetical protein DRP09_08250 [Candidatus Thorarchaeota archaeon]RLI59916.1 MAG: hypothetical protein DRO87_01475 [Candidatus Thorarchaeota archaeon]